MSWRRDNNNNNTSYKPRSSWNNNNKKNNKIKKNKHEKKMNNSSSKYVCLCNDDVLYGKKSHDIIYRTDTKNKFLGNINEFCHALFHVPICGEWDNEYLCLNDDQCINQTVVLVCRLLVNDKDVIVGRFTNCYQGGTDLNLHCEDFLVKHKLLNDIIRNDEGDKKLIIYLSYQPCHFSSGSRNAKNHKKSCTNVLKEYYNNVLKKYNAQLIIKCTNLYRAHYTDPEKFDDGDAEKFRARVQLAQEGIKILHRNGIIIDGFSEDDWKFCMNYVKNSELITKDHMRIRHQFDKLIENFLTTMK